MGYIKNVPAWLEALYAEKFFVSCNYHENAKKNEKNVFCIDCCLSVCPHCLSDHRFHRLLQIRRYVYHEVVRLEDLEKLFDCTNVQAYTINSSKVVFIKKRPQNRQFKGSGNYCTSCDRSLQEPFIHCSLGCKVDYALKYTKNLSPYLRTCKTLQLGPDFLWPQDIYPDYEIMMTSNSTVVNSEDPMMSCSSGSSGSSEINNTPTAMICTDVVRKKRTGLYVCRRRSSSNNKESSSDEDMATSLIISRRKGIPHRSPLC